MSLAGRFPGTGGLPFGVDLPRLVDATHELVAGMRADKYVDLAAAYGWDIVAGTARFATTESGPALTVERTDGGTSTVRAGHYLVATGSAPSVPPIDGLAEAGYLTSTTAMQLHALPASMIVIGGNAVGLEQAQLWSRLGVEVTVVEALDRVAPFEEPEASAVIEAAFTGEGIGVVTGGRVTAVRRDRTG